MKIKSILRIVAIGLLALTLIYHFQQLGDSEEKIIELQLASNSIDDATSFVIYSQKFSYEMLEDTKHSKSAIYMQVVLIICIILLEIKWSNKNG
jgi:hypothetical protein